MIDFNPFPKWWVIVASVIGLSWVGFAIVYTVEAWPMLSGEKVYKFQVFMTGWYWFGLVGSLVMALMLVVWIHAELVVRPHLRRVMMEPPPRPPLPPSVGYPSARDYLTGGGA